MQGVRGSLSWCAGYDALDGIAKPEVGRWSGVRRRFEPPIVRFQMPEGGARPMLQAAKRAGAIASLECNSRPAFSHWIPDPRAGRAGYGQAG
jgi:hypothetical protein